jgi:hypothetical protein
LQEYHSRAVIFGILQGCHSKRLSADDSASAFVFQDTHSKVVRSIQDVSSLPSALAICKSIIPDDLLEALRKSIIIGCLGIIGFRLGHSQTAALDLARSEYLPRVSLENMTCASLCVVAVRTLRAHARAQKPKALQTHLSRTYIYFTASVKSRGYRQKERSGGPLVGLILADQVL